MKNFTDESLDFYLERIYYHRKEFENSDPEELGVKCIDGYGGEGFLITPESAEWHANYWKEGLKELVERACANAGRVAVLKEKQEREKRRQKKDDKAEAEYIKSLEEV